jgi:hypothetical protein
MGTPVGVSAAGRRATCSIDFDQREGAPRTTPPKPPPCHTQFNAFVRMTTRRSTILPGIAHHVV